MKYRKLLNGQKVADAPDTVAMTIKSRCPKKWAFVDMETGDIWVHNSRFPKRSRHLYTFYRIDEKALDALGKALDNFTTT